MGFLLTASKYLTVAAIIVVNLVDAGLLRPH
jgi:hypothetical protein